MKSTRENITIALWNGYLCCYVTVSVGDTAFQKTRYDTILRHFPPLWPMICWMASISIFGRKINRQFLVDEKIKSTIFPESWGEEDLTRGQGTDRCLKRFVLWSVRKHMPVLVCFFDQATCTSWRLLKRTAAGSSLPSHRFAIIC